MTINKQTAETQLFEIDFTPKGTKKRTTVYVYAKNRLEASNTLILRKMWGEQHSVRYCNVNLMD